MGRFNALLNIIPEEAKKKAMLWLSNLSRKKEVYMSPQQLQKELGGKVERLMAEDPEMFDYYENIPVGQTLQEATYGDSDAVLMRPQTFKELAAPLRIEHPGNKLEMDYKIQKYKDMYEDKIPFDATPELDYEVINTPAGDIVQIIRHDGRHRTRAKEELNHPYQLVRMKSFPSGSLKDLDPESPVYSEKSVMSNVDPVKVGALGDLFKILGIPLAFIPGALSNLSEEVEEWAQ
jgi:hypothetical protein